MKAVTDFSYAWHAMHHYRKNLQKIITDNPKEVLKLKTVFLKMSTIMELPLMRIVEANSEDLRSVAQYYSGQLCKYVKDVLYVIPVNIFKELSEISRILSTEVKELEVRISKETLKKQSANDQRFIMAEKTHSITTSTEGMLSLDNVMMGMIEIEPKEILVDGLRKELCRTLANMLHKEFIFKTEHSGRGDTGAYGS